MANIYKRIFEFPNKSFLLFGPRGVGKSTLLKSQFKFDLEINLLNSSEYLPLSGNPSLLHDKVGHLKKNQWVLIDEVQKIPALLDEVHSLYESKKINFALSGSSARKLKCGGANLLAGRALQRFLFPLTQSEYIKHEIKEVVDWGTLPGVLVDPKNKIETLAAYVEMYLKQELVEEGLIRKLDPFMRFLKIAGIYNAQILNIENIARESHVGRTTVDKYFEILEDTLIGYRLPAIHLGAYAKETIHPKFYFFDCGVARASAGLIFEDIDNTWRGHAFETYILHEIRSFNHYKQRNRDLFYYRSAQGNEIDLLIELKKKTLNTPQQLLAIEIKYSKTWDKRWSKQMNTICTETTKIKKMIGVYCGSEILTQDEVTIYPLDIFLKELNSGKIF